MNYTDLEPIHHWKRRRGKVQICCPRCDRFFDIPDDITIDDHGFCSDKIYHFCDDIYEGEENNDGWCVLAHLLEWE